ncbi:MAG: hypothetical protein HQL47_09290 [Gammaproteobacteria bacterium]|nr:hypothetical protein [Gammaproteobacteria bacterium]
MTDPKVRLKGLIRLQSWINPENACWEWQGQISNSGHGRIMLSDENGRRLLSAEQASFIAFHQDLPEGAGVRQTCNNRLCVNPEHLQLVETQTPTGETLQ